jgi:hypothetical protein
MKEGERQEVERSEKKNEGKGKEEWSHVGTNGGNSTTPVAGSSWGDPPSGLAQGVPRGSSSSPNPDIKADQRQTDKQSRTTSSTEPLTYGAMSVDDLALPDDNFAHTPSPNPVKEKKNDEKKEEKNEDKNEEKNGEKYEKENESVGGGCSTTPVAGSRWGNPPSGLAQGETRGSYLSPKSVDGADKVRIRRLERPRQLSGDGKSYLRCSPLAAKFRLGSASLTEDPVSGLTDVCSNVGLIAKDVLQKYYPNTPIHPTARKISGVGEKTTIGFCVIPVWLECHDEKTKEPILAEFDVEVHVLEVFQPGFLIGLDAIRDYGIDIITSSMQGRIDGLSFPLFSTATPKFQAVKIFSEKRIMVPGRSTVPIPVTSCCMDGIDYMFTPYLTAELSIPAAPQMPRAIIDSRTRFVMFSNHSEHPVRIERRQVLGDAEAVLFGTISATTSHVIRWDDIIQPRRGRAGPSIGLKAPTTVAMEELFGKDVEDLTSFHVTGATAHNDQYAYEDELRFDTSGRELPRKRSLPETTIRMIASNAEKRTAGDRFPENILEDADVAFPSLPVDESEQNAKSWALSDDLTSEQASELLQLLLEFDEVFSDGSKIGRVKGVVATINTLGDLPPPARLRPIGPAKRAVVEQCYGGVWFAAVSLRYRYGTKKVIGREVFACDGNVIFF